MYEQAFKSELLMYDEPFAVYSKNNELVSYKKSSTKHALKFSHGKFLLFFKLKEE